MTRRKQWDELEELFNAARDLSPQERESLLGARSLEPDLRQKIDELLSAYDTLSLKSDDMFLEQLDTARASSLLDMMVDNPDTTLLSPGDVVGRYRIVRPIGRGGMGVLYLALDPRLNRSVALKLLPAHLSVDSRASRRFEEEARAASLLDHPNIATVYEVDETADGRLFIAMAYYEGETLREKLKRGPLPIPEAVKLAAQVARGLEAAHAAGLVHRDIKPANVMVTPQGVAKIVDFGIARIATDEITHAETAGTVAYMSPEQTHGAPPRPSMDVWSFGVMLYEMLTGFRPFRGDRDDAVILAIRNDEPEPIEQLRGNNVPPKLIQIVLKCMRKDPAERYADAGAIAADLRALLDPVFDDDPSGSSRASSDQTPVAGKRSRWRRQRYAIAAVAALVILSAGAIRMRNSQAEVAQAASVPHSIAVLPFHDELNTSDDDHFSAGLADELITALGAIPGLKVVALNSTVKLHDSGLDARAIGDSLRVGTVLEGSVRRDTARLRISARLVQASDRTVLWSEAYDVPMRDIFTVQEQIARSIADALNVRLTSTAGDSPLVGKPTADLEAFELYLLGRHVPRTRSTQGRLEDALAYYREAIGHDPKFANAYSGVAETYANLANYRFVSAAEGFTYANTAAEYALKLNPRLADAHASHGYVLSSEREFDQAEAAFRRALDLNPNFAMGHHYYSLLLAMLDRTDEALEQNRRARELDPLLSPAAADYGIIMCQRNELALADSLLTKSLALEPKFTLTLYWLGAVRAAEGRNSEAKQFLEQAARAMPKYPGVLGALAYVYSREGRQNAADSIVAILRARATDDRGGANLAFAYAALGKMDAAFALLKKPDWDVPIVIGLRADPLLRSLRSDPRYALLVSEIATTKAAGGGASAPPGK